MNAPRVVVWDRDNTITVGSSLESSPLYYLRSLDHVILRPGAREAAQLVRAHEVPLILATKQRGISKGLVSRELVDLINARVERLLSIEFATVLVEEEADNKRALYERILAHYPRIAASSIHLFDDSEGERTIAARMGMTVHDGRDLFNATLKAFSCG